MQYPNSQALLKAGNTSDFAGRKICGWLLSTKKGENFYFDNKDEAEFFGGPFTYLYEVLPVFCDEVKK